MTTDSTPLDPALQAQILAEVERGFSEQIALTLELVRYPSLRGQEHTAQELYYRELARRGYAMDRFKIDVKEIEHHPGFSPVKVSYDNAVPTSSARTIHGRRRGAR